MFASLSDIIKLPIAVLAGVGLSVLFYEGIRLPFIGQIVPGIVWYRVDAATANMVTKFERDTVQAQLDEEAPPQGYFRCGSRQSAGARGRDRTGTPGGRGED
ncbi:hypothetical protein [Neorhizobium galegae]|uniref:hypothetical protein n=1 Tax=Neorhizobium galegae TaxID=399 RepID=UPI001F2911C3|nr:hypothetical protein [Neorhizobium galegae]UIK04920.1 hypothetical protein LZK81_20045 [Neorhizobium galegae]